MAKKPSYKKSLKQGDVVGIKETKMVEGYYLGSRTVKVDGEDRMVHVLAAYKEASSDPTRIVQVWGSAVMDSFFGDVKILSGCRVTYKGEKESGKGQPMLVLDCESDQDYVLDATEYPDLPTL